MATACNDRYCGEKGFILPIVRHIPVTEAVKSHPVPARLLANMPKLTPSLKYALTVLRSGYLYVFNDSSKTWDGYFVPAEASADTYFNRNFHRFLAKKPQAYVNVQKNLDKSTAQKFDFKEKNSCDCKHPKPNEGILVEGALNKQTNIYFIFSDVEWTANNFKNIAENKDKYMQKVDLKTFIAKKCRDFQPHIMIDTEITDFNSYAVNQSDVVTGYVAESEDAPEGIEPVQVNTDGIISGIACLIDPVGILEELTNIAQRGHASFKTSAFMEENAYQYWLKDALDNLEFGIKANAVQVRMREHYYEIALSWSGKRGKILTEAEIDQLQKVAAATATDKDLTDSGDIAWKKYKNCFKEQSYNDFTNDFKAASKAHSDKHVEPAAKSIVTWLQYSKTTDYFDACFDKEDTEHSTIFPQVFLKCTQSTGEFGTCNKLFYQWLTDNTDNPLMRTLQLNNNEIKKIVEGQSSLFNKTTSEFAKSVNWNSVFNAYKGIFSPKQITIIDSFIGQITSNLSATLVELSNQMPSGQASPAGNKLQLLTSMHAGDVFVLQKISLSERKASIKAFIQQVFNIKDIKRAAQGKNPTSARAQQNIIDNAKTLNDRLDLKAEEFHKKNGHSGYFFVNASKVSAGDAFPSQLGKNATVLTEQEVMNIMAASEGKGAASNRVTSGVLSGILFAVSMLGWCSREVKPEDSTTAYTQLFSLVLGFSGELMERVSGHRLAASAGAETLSIKGKGLTPKQFVRHQRINATGRLFGGVAAIVLGVLDIISAVKLSRQEGYSTLVVLQFISGGLGVGLGMAMIISSTFLAGIPILARMAGTIMPRAPYIGAAILITAILIMLFTDNELEVWIKNTIWGTNTDPKYLKDFAGAQKALAEIMKKANA